MDNSPLQPSRKLPPPVAPRADGPAELLLDELSWHLGYAIKRAQLRLFENFLAAVGPLKLSPAQFSVLLLVDANPGRNQTEIAAALGILRPNFVSLLDALEARGLLSRTRSVDDRRSHVLALTEKGRTTLKQARQLVAERHERKLATVLTPTERDDLIEMLNRLAALV